MPEKPSVEEVVAMILRHGRLLMEYKGELTGIREMRKHVAWYMTGYPHSAAIRREVNQVESYGELEELAQKIIGRIAEEPLRNTKRIEG